MLLQIGDSTKLGIHSFFEVQHLLAQSQMRFVKPTFFSSAQPEFLLQTRYRRYPLPQVGKRTIHVVLLDQFDACRLAPVLLVGLLLLLNEQADLFFVLLERTFQHIESIELSEHTCQPSLKILNVTCLLAELLVLRVHTLLDGDQLVAIAPYLFIDPLQVNDRLLFRHLTAPFTVRRFDPPA